MIKFSSLRVKKLLFYEDQSFDFSSPGIKLILGKNLNSSADNPNGAGKSLFFSQLHDLLADEQLHGSKRDMTRSGLVVLTVTVGSDEYKIARKFTPAEKILIKKNGVDLEFRELSEAKSFVQSLIPYSPTAIRSLLFLDSQLPHPLISQGTTQRKDFFKDFFRLGSLNLLKKKVSALLAELRDFEVEYRTIKEEAASLKAKIDPNEDDLRRQLSELTSSRDLLLSTLQVRTRAASIREQLNLFSDLTELLADRSESEADSLVDSLKTKRKNLQAGLQAHRDYDHWKSTNQDYVQSTKALSTLLAKYGITEVSLVSSRLEKLQVKSADLTEELRKLNSYPSRLRSLREDISSSEKSADALRKSISDLKKESDTCPTCGSPYDNSHAKEELAKVKKRLSLCLETLESKHETLLETQAQLDGKPGLELRLLEVDSRIADFQQAAALSRRRPPSPPPTPPDKTPEDISARLDRVSDQLNLLSQREKYFQLITEYSTVPTSVKKTLTDTSVDQRFLTLSEELSATQVRLSSSAEARSRLSQLAARGKLLKSKLSDKPALDLLQSAFSKSGLESILIKTLCASLETQVNKYSKFLFPEDYEFKFDLESQFDILVTRKYGKKTVTSDVRKLSGAERKLFALVLLVSLMTFLPKKIRSNLLVLDEPTAAMGAENISRFVRFLPTLQKVIPTIVVITPLDAREYAIINPEIFTVVKSVSGISTIERTK